MVTSGEAKAERNIVSAAIAQTKRNNENADDQISAMQKLSADIKTIDAKLSQIDQEIHYIISVLPNIPSDDIPVGADEDDNVEQLLWGTSREFDFEVKAHWDLGESLDILDWERGAKITGYRFLCLKRFRCTIGTCCL